MYSEMIETYSEYRMALQQMEGRARPPVLLTALMGILESYRARQRMGWSRPQNKEGVRTFKTLVPTAGAMAEIAADPEAIVRYQDDPVVMGVIHALNAQ